MGVFELNILTEKAMIMVRLNAFRKKKMADGTSATSFN